MTNFAAVQDFISLEKLSPKSFIPFAVVACMIQPPDAEIAAWVRVLGNAPKIGLFLQLAGWVCVCAVVALMGIGLLDVVNWNNWSRGYTTFFIGMVFLSFGAFALCKIGGCDPMVGLNVFWELALAAYGSTILTLWSYEHDA